MISMELYRKYLERGGFSAYVTADAFQRLEPGNSVAAEVRLGRVRREAGSSAGELLERLAQSGKRSGPRVLLPRNSDRLQDAVETLCTALDPQAGELLRRWVERYPSHSPYIENGIAWVQVSGDEVSAALSMSGDERRKFPSFESPVVMNLELTTKCPLRCPQCYCTLENGLDIPLDTARYWVREAAANGIQAVEMSGGESYCYPHLLPLVAYAREHGVESNVALSGYGADRDFLTALRQSGVHGIYISLNGPTEEVNRLSRDGFSHAVAALENLRDMGFERTYLNWVMHNSNAHTLPDMLALAERYRVRGLVVMMFKPDAANQRKSSPTRELLLSAAAVIRNYRGPVQLIVENCFSQMKMLLGRSFAGNFNRGLARGCGAGSDSVSVSVDGKLTPCRHLDIREDYTSLRDYWYHSKILRQIRADRMSDRAGATCGACPDRSYCLPCLAVNWAEKNSLTFGDEACVLP